MRDFQGVKSITVDGSDLSAVLSGATNSPIAEGEILSLILDAARRGVPVFVTDPASDAREKLHLGK